MKLLRNIPWLLLAFPLILLAGKCVDQHQLMRDANGNWTIVGQIHNDTDIQATSMVLSGKLLDGDGNVLASTTAPPCPEELSPHTLAVFELNFANSAALQPVSYDVRPVSGHVLDHPLPLLGVTLSGFAATRTGEGAKVTGTIKSTKTDARPYTGCLAFYDAGGKVVTEVTIAGFGGLTAGTPQPLTLPIPVVASAATTARFWLIGPTTSADLFASDFQAAVTEAFAIY
jgi:hypothetical protein